MLAKDRQQRYPTAKALLVDVEKLLSLRAMSGARPAPTPSFVSRPTVELPTAGPAKPKRKPALFFAAGAAAVALVIVLAIVLIPKGRPKPEGDGSHEADHRASAHRGGT